MYHFIVNPTSKTGLGEKYWERVQKILDEKKIEYKVIFSKRVGHVEEIVRKLTTESKKDKIHMVILGGDGTVNEEAVSKFECIEDGEFVKLYKAPEGFVGFIDRSSNQSIIGY